MPSAPRDALDPAIDADAVTARTRAWVRRAVVGLNLCPFARAVEVRGQIRYVVSSTDDPAELLATLREEMQRLAAADPREVATTLVIHPHALTDFLDFNDFLDVADAAVEDLDLEGVLQVASFHPHYQFAGTEPDDLENATNRAPYPTLHLLREDMVSQAVDAMAEPDAIVEANQRTLEALGAAGWAELQRAIEADAAAAPGGAP